MYRIRTMVLAVIFVSLAAGICYCQDDTAEPETMTTDGYVTSTDVRNSTISIKTVNAGVYFVALDTKIKRDVYDIELPDINKGDYVQIEYYEDKTGARIARRITVEYEKGSDGF